MPGRHGDGPLGGGLRQAGEKPRTSVLGVIAALVILGITVEVVEQQSKTGAYLLVLILLLGYITFNAGQFSAQMNTLISVLNAPTSNRAARR